MFVSKFHQLGLEWVTEDNIVCSAFVAAQFIKDNPRLADKSVYMIGEAGIEEELDRLEIRHCGGLKQAQLFKNRDMQHPDIVQSMTIEMVFDDLQPDVCLFRRSPIINHRSDSHRAR